MSFTEYEYYVYENETALVCLKLSGINDPLKTGVWVHVFTSDDTATGKLISRVKTLVRSIVNT